MSTIKADGIQASTGTNMDVATQTQWATYRQALRDLPATTDDPANPTWPVAPA